MSRTSEPISIQSEQNKDKFHSIIKFDIKEYSMTSHANETSFRIYIITNNL